MSWQERAWLPGEQEAMQQVLAVCAVWGYGNTMDVIAAAWAEQDPCGALTVGPARGERRAASGAVAVQRCPSRGLGDRQCGNYAGHAGAHTLLIPTGAPWFHEAHARDENAEDTAAMAEQEGR